MRQFDNPQNISRKIAALRVHNIDTLAEINTYEIHRHDQTIARYIEVESTLTDALLENLFSTAETTQEITYLTDDAADRQQIKAEYQTTITQLQSIENAVSPTNAQVIAAVKYLAKTIRLMLKLLARLLT